MACYHLGRGWFASKRKPSLNQLQFHSLSKGSLESIKTLGPKSFTKDLASWVTLT